jgi:hypothetical protein
LQIRYLRTSWRPNLRNIFALDWAVFFIVTFNISERYIFFILLPFFDWFYGKDSLRIFMIFLYPYWILNYILFILLDFWLYLPVRIATISIYIFFGWNWTLLLFYVFIELFMIVLEPLKYFFYYYLRFYSALLRQIIRSWLQEAMSVQVLIINWINYWLQQNEFIWMPLALNQVWTSSEVH